MADRVYPLSLYSTPLCIVGGWEVGQEEYVHRGVNSHVLGRMACVSGLFSLELCNVTQLAFATQVHPKIDKARSQGQTETWGCPGPHHWHLLKLVALKHSLNTWRKQ